MCPPLVSICPLVPPFKLSNLVFSLQRCWKARVRAPVKGSAHPIYLCLPNICKKASISLQFEVLLLGSNQLQGTHLTLIPSTCDYQ